MNSDKIDIDPINLESDSNYDKNELDIESKANSDLYAQVAAATDQMISLSKSEKYKLKYLKAKKLYYSIK